jgi:trimeric autotransporter adhesin
MALSDAYKYATAEGGIGLDAYYGNINSFLANNPDQQAIADAMAQYGVSQEDVDYAKSLNNQQSGLSAVTSGKNTVLEDVSTDGTLGSTTGALATDATNTSTAATNGALATAANNTVATGTDATTGALTTAANTATDTSASTGALTQAATGSTTGNAVSDADADRLVREAYASIGRTGIGSDASQIDQEGYNAWVSAVKSGAINPSNLQTTFKGAVTDYIAQNPDDKYTKYVTDYQAKQTGTTADTTATDTTTKAADTTTKAADTTVTNGYLKANPDVAAAYLANSGGMTQDEYAQSHFTNSGAEEGRKSPFQESDSLKNAIDLKNGLFLTSDGRAFYADGREETNWNALDKSVVGNANLVKLTKQILDQGTTSHWSGQGWGSPEANAASIASALLKVGIDNIYDLGKVPVLAQVDVIGQKYNGQNVSTYQNEDGTTRQVYWKLTGQTDADGNATAEQVELPKDAKLETIYGQYDGYEGYNQVDASKVKIVNGKPVIDTGQTTFGNTKTGEAIARNFDAQQGNDILSGTTAGSGNTAFRVDFSQGAPVFYTTYASSNTLVNMFADNPILGAIANAAAAYFGGPAGVAALQAAMGKGIEDIAKGALLTYVGGQVAGNISGSTDLINSVGVDAANVIGKSVGKFVSSEGKANIITSLAGGAVDIGVGQITDNIAGFKDLSQGQQDFTRSVISTTIKNGGDLSLGDLVDAAFTAGTAATKASATGSIATAIEANKTINDAVTAEINNQTTIDASGAMDLNAAAKFAEDSGYNKFTFDGKTYTLDNNNAANTITQLESDALATNTANNLKGGEFEGVDAAVAANAKANNTVIGNAEADSIEEAAYLAKQRNPTGTTFTFDGKTYTLGASNTAVTQALNETQKAAVLDEIKNAKTFNEAFATARAGLGAGQTFTWQGKEYSTATAAERPDLSTTSIDALNKANLATTTNASSTIAAQNDTLARNAVNQSDAETARLARQNNTIASMEKTGVFGTMVNAIQNQMKLSSEAANDYLKNNPNSPITNSVSTAYEAAGNLEKNVAGGIALLTNNKPLADAFVKSGNDLTKVGQSIGNGVVDTKNWNDTTSLIQNAQGWEKLGILAGRIMDGTSGLGRQVEVELRQELPGLFLGGGSVKGILVATGAMDVGETTGNAALETYDESIKAGKTHADALSDARKAGAAAGMAEAAVQLTLGKVADVVVGKIGNIGAKAGTKIVGETVVEGGQEGGSSLAVNAILGQELDANKALTQTVLGGAVGKGTAVATSPTDIATTETINNNITAAVTSGNAASVNTAITNSVQQSLSGGSSVEVAVGSTVNSAITSGADASTSITTAVSSAVTSGADVNQTVTASVGSAITAGADSTVAINSTVTSAITSGADSSQVVSSAVTASITAGTSTETAISTSVQAAVTAGASVTTATNSAVTAAVTTAVTTGADTTTAINSSVTAAVTAGANVNTAVTTAVTAAVDSSITTAVNNGTSVATAVTSSVSSSITSAATANTSVTTAVNTAVSTAITSAVTNNANVTTAVDSAVTSAITTAVSSNVNTSTAITTAVDSAVTTAINSNVNATTAITTSVTAAINAAVNATSNTNANVNANVNAAVNSAVAAAVNAGVDTNTAVDAAVNAAVNANVNANVNTNININIDELKKSATETATSAVEKTELISTINDLLSGTPTATPDTSQPTKTSTKKKAAGLTAGLIGGAALAGDLDRLPPQMLKAYMTQDKFVDPLAKLQALQEGMNTEKMPALPQVNTQEPDMPDQGNWKYGTAPDDLDTLFGEKSEEEEGSLGFAAGGYVAPLQMASGGAMPLPLLVKSGGALGALPRGDGRLDFRHGAHVAGEGDGQSDDIKAMLADGEFVFPADVVSALGNGSTKAGSDKLYEMMHSIRARARSKKPKDLPPPALKSPLDYLKKQVRSK